MNNQEFIDALLPGALEGKKINILPSLTIGQGILESGWGKRAPGFNLFGVKWSKDCGHEAQLLWTKEWRNGEYMDVQAYFRKYNSYTESIADHTELLQEDRYAPVRAAKDYKEACLQIKLCKYATAPDYTEKLIQIIEKYKLYEFDKEVASVIPANKNIEDLQPWMRYAYKKLVEDCKKAGMKLLLIETKRSQARQTQIYEDGTGPKLLGPHGFGCAFDIAPLTDGKLVWSNYALFKRMGEIGKKIGLAWGGDWKTVDCPHFEYTGGLTDAQLRAGKLPKFPEIPGESKEGFDIMNFKLQPIAKGVLKNTTSLTCCSEPSNNKKTTSALKKGIHEPFNIFAKTKNEGINWYLVNDVNPQWVAAHYVEIKEVL